MIFLLIVGLLVSSNIAAMNGDVVSPKSDEDATVISAIVEKSLEKKIVSWDQIQTQNLAIARRGPAFGGKKGWSDLPKDLKLQILGLVNPSPIYTYQALDDKEVSEPSSSSSHSSKHRYSFKDRGLSFGSCARSQVRKACCNGERAFFIEYQNPGVLKWLQEIDGAYREFSFKIKLPHIINDIDYNPFDSAQVACMDDQSNLYICNVDTGNMVKASIKCDGSNDVSFLYDRQNPGKILVVYANEIVKEVDTLSGAVSGVIFLGGSDKYQFYWSGDNQLLSSMTYKSNHVKWYRIAGWFKDCPKFEFVSNGKTYYKEPDPLKYVLLIKSLMKASYINPYNLSTEEYAYFLYLPHSMKQFFKGKITRRKPEDQDKARLLAALASLMTVAQKK